MKIHKLIEPENVFLDLAGSDARSALGAVASVLAGPLDLDSEEVAGALLEREGLGSTSVGEGFAIPHCKIDSLEKIVIGLARFDPPVPFGDSTQQPVAFMFVVLSPPDHPAAHLQVLSQIARVLKRRDLRAALLAAADAEGVTKTLCEAAEAEGL